MKGDKLLSMTFSVEEWQLICVACARVRQTSLIDPDGSKIKELRAIAKTIAIETGKLNALRDLCEWYVAREIARPAVPKPHLSRDVLAAWAEATKFAKAEAREKILAMNNLELLDLIGKVIAQHA
jgi:hypothetical protein